MHALVLAGGLLPREDPLFDEAPEGRRCLIDIHGRPMVQWVIDALSGAACIKEIFVIGLTAPHGLVSSKPIHTLEGKGGLFENIRAGVIAATEKTPPSTKVLLASGDLPAIQPEMVAWLCEKVSQDPDREIYYNVITREVMTARFPDANRTFIRLKDTTVCGGDLNVVDRALFSGENPLWNKLAKARKNPLKQVSLLGLDSLILVALRLITLQEAVRRVCKKLDIDGRALISPYAEMGMDADKPDQLEILRKALEN